MYETLEELEEWANDEYESRLQERLEELQQELIQKNYTPEEIEDQIENDQPDIEKEIEDDILEDFNSQCESILEGDETAEIIKEEGYYIQSRFYAGKICYMITDTNAVIVPGCENLTWGEVEEFSKD